MCILSFIKRFDGDFVSSVYPREIKLKGNVEIPPEEVLWSCTTCSTCETRCPKELSPYEILVGMRGISVEEGKVSPPIRDARKCIQTWEPLGKSQNKKNRMG